MNLTLQIRLWVNPFQCLFTLILFSYTVSCIKLAKMQNIKPLKWPVARHIFEKFSFKTACFFSPQWFYSFRVSQVFFAKLNKQKKSMLPKSSAVLLYLSQC